MPPFLCPHCGHPVPAQARVCPECGADDDTGWSEEAQADRLGIPSEDFDYHEFVSEEFGPSSAPSSIRPHGISWFWWGMAVLILSLLLLGWVF